MEKLFEKTSSLNLKNMVFHKYATECLPFSAKGPRPIINHMRSDSKTLCLLLPVVRIDRFHK